MRNKWIEITLNILFWLLSVWLISTSFSIAFVDIEVIDGEKIVNIQRDKFIIIQLLTLSSLCLIMFYSNLWQVFRLIENRNLLKTTLIALTIYVSTLILYYLIESLPFYAEFPNLSLSLSVGITTFYFTVSGAYGLVKVWIVSEANRQTLLLEKKQAELSLLRSQLQPHFLFNTLNNLLAMTNQKQNPKLANSLNTLSYLLRYVVYDTTEGKVKVKKEIEFIRNFAELQLLRFEENEIDFQLEIKGSNDHQFIEPGIFVSFIENAFKFGTEPEQNSVIKVEFDITESNKVGFYISNKIYHETLSINNPSTGISSVKKRLEIVYPGKHILNIRKNDFFVVELEIETDESNNS